ncbi:hypothetical protein BC830DRAFT_1117354 [Chytriomyces sp. MP71]|nr:hypothetical protein BC830DRAFT_1117354 [Chytriomyces sp. MP71]
MLARRIAATLFLLACVALALCNKQVIGKAISEHEQKDAVGSAFPLDSQLERRHKTKRRKRPAKFKRPIKKTRKHKSASQKPTLGATTDVPYSDRNIARIRKSRSSFSSISTGSSYYLQYFGGPLLTSVQVTNIFLGRNVTYQSETNIFIKFLVRSPLFDLVSAEYSVPGMTIGYGSFVTSFVETKNSIVNKMKVTDEMVQTYLLGLIKSRIISPNPNSAYSVYLQPGVVVTQQGLNSCSDFCGYHGTIDIKKLGILKTPYLYYVVYPDQSGTCFGGCGIGNPFQNLCSVISHELTEVVTDGAINVVLGADIVAPMAWYDPNSDVGGEIGDMCNTQEGQLTDSSGAKWTVQKIWSNRYKQCLFQNPRTTTTSTLTTTTTVTKSSSLLVALGAKKTTTSVKKGNRK